jgi:predicted nucleic-acid-binding protein
MIGLDTNILVRYIMQDDAKQAPLVANFVESLTADEPGFVSLVSVVELVWVLSSCFELERSQLVTVLDALLCTKELRLERAEVIGQALRRFRDSSADFADCLIERCAAAAGCSHTMTFDRAASKHAGMTLLQA